MKFDFLHAAASETVDIVEDMINWCLLHLFNALMAIGLSWVAWIFFTSWLSTTVSLMGHGSDDPDSGPVRELIFQQTGYSDPWVCLMLLGLGSTFLIGLMRVAFGIWDAATEGQTEEVQRFVHGTKLMSTALHMLGFGLTTGIAAIENIFDSGGVGELSIMSSAVGASYLYRGATAYETPVRYVINLFYGAAIFAVLFPLELHGIVGSFENIQNGEWLWLVWTLFLALVGIAPTLLYCQAAWYQGYGLGLWLGSWVTPRGWKLRRVYRMFALDPLTV